jgi:uncharacterized protein
MENESRRWPAFGRVLLFFASCAVLLATTAPLARRIPVLAPAFFIGTVASLGTFALTVLFVRWEGIGLKDVGASLGRQSLPRFAVGILLGLLLVALHTSIVAFEGHVRWVRAPGVSFFEAATALATYLLLSCREELAFHGYPLRRLEHLRGLLVSLLIVAFVFAIEHMAGGSTWVESLFGASIGSLLFGMASIATKGLAVPIGLHAAWNFGDWMRGGKSSSGLWKLVVADGFHERVQLVAMSGYAVVMLSATFAFWWWYRRSMHEGQGNVPRVTKIPTVE